MKLIKPVLWTVLGVVIGATAVLAADRVQAQQKPVPERIVVTAASGMNLSGLSFVKDTKSGGCWIAVKEGANLSSLAVAPPSACY